MSELATPLIVQHPSPITPGRPRYRYTEKQYLSFERGSPSKHDYYDGDIYAFTGANQSHVLIVGNLICEFHARFRRSPFRFYASQMRLKVLATGLHTYPDLMIVRGEGHFVDDQQDMLTNPEVIIEVVSPETSEYDRGEKLGHFRTIESLKEILLVAQDARRVEHHARQPDGSWNRSEVTGRGVVSLPSIGCELPLDEIYEQIEFPA